MRRAQVGWVGGRAGGGRGSKGGGAAELGGGLRLTQALVPLPHRVDTARWRRRWPFAVAAFREWYLAQLEASDAQLRQLAGGQAPPNAAEQLQGTLRRLGLTAEELARLPSGQPVNGGGF